ncbi:protein cup-like isoform X1 [Anopheles funestus]|uniref:protein cup-like isoform X1 n=1 Tax=Anopheles funestus TaxID=62324 RepID=UPI0020C6C00E|nr:protein cup-like isoform X1 [Anopheles funestus]
MCVNNKAQIRYTFANKIAQKAYRLQKKEESEKGTSATSMMKFVNSDTTTMSLRHGEQYENCSELLIETDMTSLEELDPAILSCGLPAIVLNEEDLTTTMGTPTATQNPLPSSLMASCSFGVATVTAANVIRYTVAHLLALRKSPFSHRRPAAIDDPRTALFPIWSRTGFNHHQDRVRRVSGSDEDLLLGGGSGAYGRKPNDRQRDNGFNPPRFRRNHEFSNRNHHVIVKSYNASDPCGGGQSGAMRLQDTIIEEEPEWVVAGPTSRLDTIELRGFDEDMSRTVAESMKTSPPCGKQRGVFFDELLHYEHVHPKHGNKHDLSGGAGDGESVSTSNNGSPPPARSTPTKGGPDMNNNSTGHGRKLSGMATGSSSSVSGGVNVTNFEELMKFDSILGDSGESTSSRFNKYYHRGTGGGAASSGSGTGGGHHYQHHYSQQQQQQQHQQHHVRFALDRNTHHYNNTQQHRQAGSGRLSASALQHPPAGVEPFFPGTSGSAPASSSPSPGDAKSFQRLLEMLAAQNQRNYQQHQQHYLLQLLQNCQETETLRQMLLKKCSLENATAAASANFAGGQQNQRIPTQAELQQHTQSIMKQALLRKKIAEQSRYLLEQQQQIGQEPIPAVQQLIQSICPNVQRSLSALAGNGSTPHVGTDGRNEPGSVGGSLFAGGNRVQMRPLNRRY